MKRVTIMLLLSYLAMGCKPSEKEIHPETKDLTAAVYASGTLMPAEEYKVTSQADGYLDGVFVHEGDSVKKGQILFSLTNDVRLEKERSARATSEKTMPLVNVNSPVFRELRARITHSKSQMEEDSIQYARYKVLRDQNAISRSTYEKFEMQYKNARQQWENLNHEFEQQSMSAKLQWQQVQNQVAISNAELRGCTLRSIGDGRVYEVYKKAGDIVAPNQPVALVGSRHMVAKLMVDEDDLGKVARASKVVITADAFPGKVFSAHVSRVYPMINKIDQSFRVDAEFDEDLPAGMYGLNLEANIITDEKKQVMVIPKSALLKGDSVLVKDETSTKAVKIEKGVEDDEWVEVRKGLVASSKIIVRL